MCGRFTLAIDAEELQEDFGLTAVPVEWSARYNLAPTQSVVVVASADLRQAEWMRWGLIPSWAKDMEIGSRMINARAETLLEKPSFKNAFLRRRCLILADGFYEWKKSIQGKLPSVPYYFQLKDGKPFAFAGLWEFWRSPEGAEIRSCTIITCPPNELVADVHDRMPVILSRESMWNWLKPAPAEQLTAFLRPFAASEMQTYPVSRSVNSPDHDGSDLILPTAA